MKFIWAGLWADLWLEHHNSRGWVATIVWLSFAATILVIAGWPEEGYQIEVVKPELPELPEADING